MVKQIKPKGAEVYDITNEDVITSGLIDNLDPMFLKFIGKNWFKDGVTGTAYHFIKDDAGVLSVKETRQSVADTKRALRGEPRPPKAHKISTTDIKCIDCGAIRTIKVQDAFQVKRCILCQRIHRIARQKEKIQAKKNAPSPLGNV